MPRFEDDKAFVAIDTDGANGDFIIEIADESGKKSKLMRLSIERAKALSEQIGYAVEFVNLYDRGPR